jgi:NAD(P)-dependent dehydrogenase (short-subunit alcohol dehydrogenase family)
MTARRLEGLVALVTGAGQGIGKAVALGMAAEGASVVVNDLGTTAFGEGADESRGERVAREVREQGGQAIVDPGDIADRHAAKRMVDSAIDTWGKLDIVVNVAGIIRMATIVDATEDDWESVMRVHLRGYFNTAQFAARHWIERNEYGRLINFASGASLLSQPTLVSYSAAKTGVVGLTRSCANALAAYNVTANCIRPAAMSPGMGDATLPSSRKQFEETGKWMSQTAVGTDADPVHIVPLIVFLASPAASHVSGRFLEARGSHYALWTEPAEERVFEANFIQDPEKVYSELEQTLCSGLSLKDLKYPMAPILDRTDWREVHGVNVPRWDFEESPLLQPR